MDLGWDPQYHPPLLLNEALVLVWLRVSSQCSQIVGSPKTHNPFNLYYFELLLDTTGLPYPPPTPPHHPLVILIGQLLRLGYNPLGVGCWDVDDSRSKVPLFGCGLAIHTAFIGLPSFIWVPIPMKPWLWKGGDLNSQGYVIQRLSGLPLYHSVTFPTRGKDPPSLYIPTQLDTKASSQMDTMIWVPKSWEVPSPPPQAPLQPQHPALLDLVCCGGFVAVLTTYMGPMIEEVIGQLVQDRLPPTQEGPPPAPPTIEASQVKPGCSMKGGYWRDYHFVFVDWDIGGGIWMSQMGCVLDPGFCVDVTDLIPMDPGGDQPCRDQSTRSLTILLSPFEDTPILYDLNPYDTVGKYWLEDPGFVGTNGYLTYLSPTVHHLGDPSMIVVLVVRQFPFWEYMDDLDRIWRLTHERRLKDRGRIVRTVVLKGALATYFLGPLYPSWFVYLISVRTLQTAGFWQQLGYRSLLSGTTNRSQSIWIDVPDTNDTPRLLILYQIPLSTVWYVVWLSWVLIDLAYWVPCVVRELGYGGYMVPKWSPKPVLTCCTADMTSMGPYGFSTSLAPPQGSIYTSTYAAIQALVGTSPNSYRALLYPISYLIWLPKELIYSVTVIAKCMDLGWDPQYHPPLLLNEALVLVWFSCWMDKDGSVANAPKS
ncbi:hypothetical protein G9A89_000216 [Geosiphon pyriformis]|nr:hypothetical protein G9A89_000216 [Geosiphon pyriformis]